MSFKFFQNLRKADRCAKQGRTISPRWDWSEYKVGSYSQALMTKTDIANAQGQLKALTDECNEVTLSNREHGFFRIQFLCDAELSFDPDITDTTALTIAIPDPTLQKKILKKTNEEEWLAIDSNNGAFFSYTVSDVTYSVLIYTETADTPDGPETVAIVQDYITEANLFRPLPINKSATRTVDGIDHFKFTWIGD